ncbi:hypothetical protein [Zhihengliuella halotolerans]|uniref:hypothetical protein n=1 Tax=Zhihengliuella halotolerans TaxID=370736 RepID=UPI000C805BFA|nr:hypothetical protein [Zhihengliuella halotolerans]
MAIIRTFRRNDDGSLDFREAWYESYEDDALGQFVVNHGAVGHTSTTKDVKDVDEETGASLLAAFEAQCAEDGYAEIPVEQQFWAIAQWPAKTAGAYAERLRDTAVQVLTGHLAWRGLGTIEQTSFGTGTLNLHILTPDAKKVVPALKAAVREHDLDLAKLRIGVAPYSEPTALKQKHPSPPKPFSID